MTCELEKIAMEKGINLSFIPRYPINSYYERLCAVKNNDEIIIASWSGNTLEVAAGDLKEITANNVAIRPLEEDAPENGSDILIETDSSMYNIEVYETVTEIAEKLRCVEEII